MTVVREMSEGRQNDHLSPGGLNVGTNFNAIIQ